MLRNYAKKRVFGNPGKALARHLVLESLEERFLLTIRTWNWVQGQNTNGAADFRSLSPDEIDDLLIVLKYEVHS